MYTTMDDTRVEKGRQFAERIWFSLAKRILMIAGEHYKWTEEQWEENINLFLRPNDYKCLVN